jgi:nitrate reductase NapA
MPTSGQMTRRDLVRLLGGVAAANGLGALTWGILEAGLRHGPVDAWHRSVCRFCGTGCAIRVGLHEGRVVDIRADELAHNRGMVCVKGSMLRSLPEVEGRLTVPKIRRGGALVDATWDEAMSLVASRFREVLATSGPQAVAFYGSGQLLTEESYTANKLFKAGLRTNNVDGNPRLCMSSAASGYVAVYGKDEPPGCYDDFHHADCFFVMGANPAECHPVIWEHVRRRKREHPDTTVIVVDPRRTSSAQIADIHLAPAPGTDLLLLNAMAQVMCVDGLVDHAFVAEHLRFVDDATPTDYAGFEAFLADYTPEKVSSAVGVAAHDIRRVAHRFARAQATTSMWTMGVNQRTDGTALNTMLNALHLITAQFGRPGATPFSLTGQQNACGGVRDTGALAHALPNGRQVAVEAHRREMEDLWRVPPGTLSPEPGLAAVDLFRAMADGRVQAALVMCTNPAQSMPASSVAVAGLERAFVVVADAFEDTQTSEHADVLLPAALWIEKTGVVGQGERRYQLVERLLDPPGMCRSDLDILVDLANRLGYGHLITARTPEAVWDEWREISGHSKYDFRGITYARLREERGLQWPCPDAAHPGTPRRYVDGDPFVAAGAGVEFYGQHDKRAVVYLRRYSPSPELPDEAFPLVLTTGRVLEQWHTGTMTMRIPELAEAAGAATFEMHEVDAGRAGITDGDGVRVVSRFGAVTGRARVTRSPRPGVVFASFYDVRLLVNRAVADHVDPTSKQPAFKVTAIQVERQA